MRALIVTNLYPTAEHPRLGRFVADQVEAMRELGADVELFTFPTGAGAYLPAARRLRKLLKGSRFDVVHAHYGLCGWVARLAGAKPLVVTFHGTDVRHRIVGPSSRLLTRGLGPTMRWRRRRVECDDKRLAPARRATHRQRP